MLFYISPCPTESSTHGLSVPFHKKAFSLGQGGNAIATQTLQASGEHEQKTSGPELTKT